MLNKQQLKKRLVSMKYKVYDFDANTVYITAKYKKKQEIFDKLLAAFQLEGAKHTTQTRLSGDGHIEVGRQRIAVVPEKQIKVDIARIKPKLGKYDKIHEKNEAFLEKAISQVVYDTMKPLTVIFIAPGRRYIAKNVIGTKIVGRQTTDRKKADVLILTTSTKIPVSIKMDTASFYETADKYWGKNAKKLIEYASEKDLFDGKVSGKNIRLNKSLSTKATAKEEKDVVFGSDVYRNGFVIRKTFKATDFIYDGRNHTLIVRSNRIIMRQPDLKTEDKAWFTVRNKASSRSISIGYTGVTVDAVPKKKVASTHVIIDRNYIR